jgi:CxxC-x17-CxxC domain-containing protein
MEFQDKVLACITCGRTFMYTAREQEFYKEKGFIEPKHCRECRQQRKMRRESMAQEVPVGIDPGTSRALFEVICAECGKRTQVPFKPLTGKPILCKDCFVQKKNRAVGREKVAPSPLEVPEAPSDGHVAVEKPVTGNIDPVSETDKAPGTLITKPADPSAEDSPDSDSVLDEAPPKPKVKRKTKSEGADAKALKAVKIDAKSDGKDSETGEID